MLKRKEDKELTQYRGLLEPPEEFRDGFGWTTVVGIFFCGLIMLPGGIYLALMTGYGVSQAAAWVTVILFMEIARRALKPMSQQNLVVLLHAAYIMVAGHILFPGGPMGHLVYRAYLATSEVVRDAGMAGAFPSWFVPPLDSPALTERILWHKDWLVPIALVIFMWTVSVVNRYTMGYFFFRLTSDIEKLPFPLAAVNAQGAMALAEADPKGHDDDETGSSLLLGKDGKKKKSLRWQIFSLGLSIGLAFGFVQIGIPAITGLFLAKPFYLIPQPYVETTTLTEGILPATPTGLTFDLGIIFMGFVLPFWAVMGTFIAICMTLVMNPLMHHFGVLQRWQPGMDTVNTTFANHIDFWMSFTVGAGLGIAAVCLFSVIRDVRRKRRELLERRGASEKTEDLWTPPREGRGDYPLWMAFVGYALAAGSLVAVSFILLPKSMGLLTFLIIFAFIYSPFFTYVNTRLLGISGQQVQIPLVREAAFLLSGARGIAIWLAPIPITNTAYQSQSFRINELTGVKFTSLIKTELVAMPILFILSLTFWSFIWRSEAIPSETFPYAQINWELHAKQQVLLFSSTYVAPGEDPNEKSIMDSEFMKAVHPKAIGAGFAMSVGVFTILTMFGLPVMLIYGMMRGFGYLPHYMALEVVGAMLGRYYFQKKYGKTDFLRSAPVLLAGYMTGQGLIGMATIALKLMKAAISSAPI